MLVTTPLFNREWYLTRNPDVAEAVAQGLLDPLEHFLQYGLHEGRSPGPLLDVQYYLRHNPDVAAAVSRGETTAYDHFLSFGVFEGRAPIALFDASYYLTHNPDVAQAVRAGDFTPIQHFIEYGQYEGRVVTPIIDLGAYMGANPDVYRAVQEGGMSAMEHLMLYGIREKRDLGNGIDFGMMDGDPVFLHLLAEGRIVDALLRVTEVAPYLPDYGPPDPDPPGPDPDPYPGPGPWGTWDNPYPLKPYVPEYHTPDTENFIKLADLSASQWQIVHAELGENHFFATSSAALTDHLAIDAGCGCSESVLYATLDQPLNEKYAPFLLNIPLLNLTAQAGSADPGTIGLDLINSAGIAAIINTQSTADLAIINVPVVIDDEDPTPLFLAAVDIDESAQHDFVVVYKEPMEPCGCGSEQFLALWNAHLDRFSITAVDGAHEVSVNISSLLIWAMGDSSINSFSGNGASGSGLDGSLSTLMVAGQGSLELNIAELKGNGEAAGFVYSDLAGYEAEALTLKLAELDVDEGNKSDLSTVTGERKSDHLIALPPPMEGAIIEIQNMTLTSTWGYTAGPVFNDLLDLTAWSISDKADLAGSVLSLTIKQGDLVKTGDTSHYVDFIFCLDLDGAGPAEDTTLILSNVVTDDEYNVMLKAIDTVNRDGLESTLCLIDPDGPNLMEDGALSEAFSYPSDPDWSIRLDSDNVEDSAAIQGIIGILVDEGSFIFGVV